jgi:ADP-dependent NAD(P)H-hydrate dehydratase / NAD(P)H-hydrate epimerase
MSSAVPLFTPEQVREADQHAFSRGVPPDALMERAAGHLARGVVGLAGRGYGLRVAIHAGKGNNGGDGVAAARRLREAGAQAVVHLVAGEEGLGELGVAQLRRWRALGGRVVEDAAAGLDGADVAVDCLLGTGASGAPRGAVGDAVAAINSAGLPTVACDLPTGVDADTGRVPGAAIRADLTVTLGAHKRGLWLWPARGHCGKLVLGPLGLEQDLGEPVAQVLGADEVRRIAPPSAPTSHKRTRGVVLVVAGSDDMSGAAVLVARGALAAGAGLVTVATSALARHFVAPNVPEAMTTAIDRDDPDAAFASLAARLDGFDAVAIGPGLGHDDPTVHLVRRLVAETDVPMVLDADGINAFRHDGDALGRRAGSFLALTPHAQEFGRLVGASGHEVWGTRVTRVPDAAAAWNVTIAAKGPGTLVAAPDGRVWINDTGDAALATGGTGDVLTGITATLVAQRPEPESVAAGVWLHGVAGRVAGRRRTPRPVTAMDVAEAMSEAFRVVETAPGGPPR